MKKYGVIEGGVGGGGGGLNNFFPLERGTLLERGT